jgi:hypothetical protein
MTEQIQSRSILDMPNECKGMLRLGKRHYQLFLRLKEIEIELQKIQKDCPEKTKCYLRYGSMLMEPYAPGFPIAATAKVAEGKMQYEGVEEWQIVLADFYAMEANKLLEKRDAILKEMYAVASRYVRKTSVSCTQFRHLRKPWFTELLL